MRYHHILTIKISKKNKDILKMQKYFSNFLRILFIFMSFEVTHSKKGSKFRNIFWNMKLVKCGISKENLCVAT